METKNANEKKTIYYLKIYVCECKYAYVVGMCVYIHTPHTFIHKMKVLSGDVNNSVLCAHETKLCYLLKVTITSWKRYLSHTTLLKPTLNAAITLLVQLVLNVKQKVLNRSGLTKCVLAAE